MGIRAKFMVRSKNANDEGASIQLDAVINGSKENEEFFKYTPSGSLSLGLVNKGTADQFTVGQEFYLDLTPVDPTKA